MVKINRPFYFIYSILVFFITCFVSWLSLRGYVAFFQLSDVVFFSWKLGLVVFGAPLVFQISYFCFFSAIKNQPIKMNNKVSNVLVLLALSGVVISFFSSLYISHSLNEQGYTTCPKHSWMDPNKYVKDIALCDEW
ncbi:DUF1240 domain-containing protein [Pectobacterium cacticida]|uniref:DUF1240 domain-containing protein n=1 Tax=Pectobacterium cacticida TaxID=69221 RepID=UPI002FF10215